MVDNPETVRYQVTMRKETGDKINELANRLNLSQSKMIEALIETAIEDNEWLIKAVTSRWAKALTEVLKPILKQGKKIPKEAK